MRYFSVFDSDQDILKALSDIHLKGKWYDLDPTYSKGVFWDGLKKPKYCSDLNPCVDGCKKDDCTKLNLHEDGSLNAIVFDPPFLFRSAKSVNNDKMCKRFSYFKSFTELTDMYKESLIAFHRVLRKGGYVFFKCQDMNENKFYCTHCWTIMMAESVGFELKDIAIKRSKNKLQRDAKQQSCVAKTHSYWLVFKKKDHK